MADPDALEPIEDMIARIERTEEHRFGVCSETCFLCIRLDCDDCEKVALGVLGHGALKTEVFPCRRHSSPSG